MAPTSSDRHYPAGHVFYRKLRRSYPQIVRGQGVHLFDDAGRSYIDGSGGAFVVNIGHGVAEIGEAMARQASRVAYVNGTMFTNEPVEAAATLLAARAPGDLDHVYFLNSGSEAVEAALKFARQYWFERNRPTKHKVLALSPSYHGNTLLALSASARPHYRTLYEQWLVPVPRIPAPYSYRCSCHGRGQLCPTCTGEALELAIREEDAGTIAAFIAEPVGGSSTGASVPDVDYWARVREICTRNEILFIADEVLSGAGRTGTWSALEPYGVVPDLIVMGKGITSGYAALSAMIAPRRIIDVVANGSGALQHAQTFSHHAVACAAAVAVIEYIERHDLIGRSARMGSVLHAALASLATLPNVGDVRGRGMLAGIEFVADKATRAPLPRSMHFAETFAEAALDAGLVVWPSVGQADGTNGDIIMIAPPFTISAEEIGEIVSRLRLALDDTLDA